ncbi:uncharacterized protein [Nicotiana tomentosiformis]|uniref:uncharacterized protein n=1 Tax=Nicotiana tomentosiformis TaxID=4098 RepID=UPI00388CAE58
MSRDYLDIPIYVSIPVGDSIVVDHVYYSCMVNIASYETSVDLLLLNVVEFDVILGMDLLSPYHAILDFHANIVILAMTGLPRLECRGSVGHNPSRAISFMKAQWMVEEGCLAYLAFVKDVCADTLMVDSIPVEREFLEVFPTDLPGMLRDWDIYFGTDLAPDTQPISIPLYCMAPAE